ncbi:hypothetical protein ACS0TY_036895 [Phlomoides rotata]
MASLLRLPWRSVLAAKSKVMNSSPSFVEGYIGSAEYTTCIFCTRLIPDKVMSRSDPTQ